MLSSVPWHYWIGVVIAASAILMIPATIIGYVAKVTKGRYPNKRR